jgi:hypothetical protein
MATGTCHAQSRKPTAHEVAAIRDCAKKYETNVDEGERRCLFDLVPDPCTKTPEGSSNLGTADCFRIEGAIWDGLLNENYKALATDLDDQQMTKLREMQRAWIAYRDTTCEFYWNENRWLDGRADGRGLCRAGDGAAGHAAQILQWPIERRVLN